MTEPSRKELLKRDDAFTEAAAQGADWATRHRIALLVASGVVAVVVVAIWGTHQVMQHRDAQASSVFAEGWRIVDHGIVRDPNGKVTDAADDLEEEEVPGESKDARAERLEAARKAREKREADAPKFLSNKDKWGAARQKFEAVLEQAGYRGVGVLAAFMAANLSESLGETDKAEGQYKELRSRLSPSDHLYYLAAERTAYMREHAGDLDGALSALSDLAADDAHFYADYAQVHQARLYLVKKEPDRARSMFEHVEHQFPNSSLMDDVRAELEELGGEVDADEAPLAPSPPAGAPPGGQAAP